MSGLAPGRDAGPRGGSGETRAFRIAAAILLLLLVIVLAVGVLRRNRAGPRGTPSPAPKGPSPRGDRDAGRSALSPPSVSGASSPGREHVSGWAGPRGRARRLDSRAVGPQRPVMARYAPSPPVVVDGELRLFIAGIVSLPIILSERETRMVVESTGDGGPAEVVIAAAPGGTAAVSVLSGTIAVAAGSRCVRVGPGAFTTVGRGTPPAPPETLPASPDRGALSGGS